MGRWIPVNPLDRVQPSTSNDEYTVTLGGRLQENEGENQIVGKYGELKKGT